jgi:hypothetical protein
MQAAHQSIRSTSDARRRMIAAINIQWPQLRPDLRFSRDELRDERLAYITGLLNLRKPLGSITELSDKQLGVVLDDYRHLREGNRTPQVHPFRRKSAANGPSMPGESAEVIHLATPEQVHTLDVIFHHVGWNQNHVGSFVAKRYRRRSTRMLTPKQAGALLMIMLSIGAQHDLKQQFPDRKFSRDEIHAEIPNLKARLGIDQ